jgi:hypothetical protein
MRVGADSAMLVVIAVIVALLVGGRWRHWSRSRTDLQGAKAGVGKARSIRNAAFRSILLPVGAFGLFIYLVLANIR